MAKLTKGQRAQVDRALYHAKRARAYLFDVDTAICRRCTWASTTLHYTRIDVPGGILEVAKEYGSDLCGLDDAIKELEQFCMEGLK